MVKLLLKDGRVDPTERDTLRMAADNDDIRMVEALLEDGRVDPAKFAVDHDIMRVAEPLLKRQPVIPSAATTLGFARRRSMAKLLRNHQSGIRDAI